jgi:hypothetical protein
MARYRITISGSDREAMLDLVRKHHIDVSDHGGRAREAGGYSVDAVAEEPVIAMLASLGYRVDKHEDVDRAGRERQKQVGKGNRYLKLRQ